MRGGQILEALRQVVREVLSLSPPPGEGLERELRRRIVEALLKRCLGWEDLRIFYGEGFDILCHDESGIAVAYIETKDPREHPIPEDERFYALRRARAASTLEVFYLTNGRAWERYSLPEAKLEATLDIETASPEEAGRFFEPLRAERFRAARGLLAEAPHFEVRPGEGVRELAEVLRGSVEGLSPAFEELLKAFVSGELRNDVPERCFSDWQLLSGRAPLHEVEAEFRRALERVEGARDREAVLDEEAGRLADLLSLPEGPRFPEGSVRRALGRALLDEGAVREAVCDLLSERGDVRLFCVQTAHVVVGRVLLFRVAEDKGLMPRALSGPNLRRLLEIMAEQTSTVLPFAPPPRFLHLYSQLRSFFVSLDRVIFKMAIYDWWVVDQAWREELPWEKEVIIRRFEGRLNRALFDLILRLSRFDLSRIQGDVWRDIYQQYLPPKDRLALGGFYTDERLAGLILELAGYDGSTLLDPACGSGTFLVEALEAARRRAEREAAGRGPRRAVEVLERIGERLRGIDIHPFAVFLTRMNLLLNCLDLVAQARTLSITYSPPFRVFEADYLEKGRVAQLSLERLRGRNSRASETIRRLEEAERLKAEPVRFVVGNPPWGGVLMRGRPLEGKARHYREQYRSATGKFDIFVLFMERGLEQLEEGGRLAFVTQNRYLTSDYGRGIRRVLVERGSVEAVVDLGEVGGRLYFPGQTNYPCITVVRRGEAEEARVVRVEAEGPFEPTPEAERALRGALLRVLGRLEREREAEERPFEGVAVRGRRVPQKALRRWAEEGRPWELMAAEDIEARVERLGRNIRCIPLTDALTVDQGATPGGAQQIFVLPERVAREERLEREALRPVIRGRDIGPFEIRWAGLVAIYPYRDDGSRLDLGAGIWVESNERAVGEVEARVPLLDAPRAALFLARRHYTELCRRVFERKSLRQMGKEWFEWHRPRDPRRVAGAPKIVGRRQIPPGGACFAVDTEGYLALDSCVVLNPRREGNLSTGPSGEPGGWEGLVGYLRRALGREPTEVEALNFVVALLNTDFCARLLRFGRVPQRGGYVTVGERELSRVPIPLREEGWALELAARLAKGEERDASRLFEL